MLLELLAREDTDLVVLGSRGLSGVAALRAGSLTTVVAGRAPCSVLLAKAG